MPEMIASGPGKNAKRKAPQLAWGEAKLEGIPRDSLGD